MMLTKNELIKDLSWPGLQKMFSSYTNGSYVPLTILSYAFEFHFFQLHAFNYHLTNLLLHTGNTLLVFWLLQLITKDTLLSFLSALFFAINPLKTEPVAWISARKDLLFAFFYLGSLISYLYYIHKRNSPGLLASCFALFLLATLAKPQAISLPFILMAIDSIEEPTQWTSHLISKIPFLLIAAISIYIGQSSLVPYLSEQTYYNSFNLLDKLFLTAFSIVFYITQSLLPIQTSCIYPYPLKLSHAFPLGIYLSPFLILSSAALIYIKFRKQKTIVFASLFFIFTLILPLSNIWLGGYFASDRYMYLPSVGLFLGLCYFFLTAAKNRFNSFLKWTKLLTIIFILFLCVLSAGKCFVWKNDMTLWTDMLETFPNIALAYNNRGGAYMEYGEYEHALDDFNQAIHLNPKYKDAFFNRGLLYTDTSQFEKAIANYDAIIALDSKHIESYNNRGFIYFKLDNYPQALKDFTKALAIDPTYKTARMNLAECYVQTKDYDNALLEAQYILNTEPSNQEALKIKETINRSKQKTHEL